MYRRCRCFLANSGNHQVAFKDKTRYKIRNSFKEIKQQVQDENEIIKYKAKEIKSERTKKEAMCIGVKETKTKQI